MQALKKNARRLKPKSKELIEEAADIVINSESDEAAIQFLRETLDDDFPDLELGSMDLHEAIKVLGADEDKVQHKVNLKNLDEALAAFMKRDAKNNKKKRKRKRRRRK